MKTNTRYKISTPSGYQHFSGIQKITKPNHLVIKLSNNKTIKCSDNHPFILNGKKILANKLKIGTKIDSSKIGKYVSILEIKKVEESLQLYDPINVEGGSLFNVDGIVSHNCDFIASGWTVIDPSVITWYEENQVSDPLEMRGFDKSLWIWKEPDYSKEYLIVADVARGDGTDYSAAHVIDLETVEQVAEYKGKMGTKDFGNFLVGLATQYNQGLLVIENTGIGWAAIQPAIDKSYPKLYYSYKYYGYLDVETFLMKGHDLKDKGDMVPGFTTSTRSRPLVISKLETYTRERIPIIRSKRLINEMRTFVWKETGKAEAESKKYNDDLIMSFGIAFWIRDTHLRLMKEGIELHKTTISSMANGLTPVFNAKNTNHHNPYEMKYGNHGESVDLREFLG